jgi:DNA-binding NarL/FixJ family response regulator
VSILTDVDQDAAGRSTARRGVVVCDDHPISAQALAAWLNDTPDLEVVGSAATFDELVELNERLRPLIVVMDLALPDLDGIAATERLRAIDPEVRVVMFSGHTERRLVLGALRAGACGFLPKGTSGARLVECLRAAAAGESALAGAAADAVISHSVGGTGDVGELTSRQIEVLEAAASGMTRRQIASSLHISFATVRTHLEAIYARLGAHNISSAVAEARSRGILTDAAPLHRTTP